MKKKPNKKSNSAKGKKSKKTPARKKAGVSSKTKPQSNTDFFYKYLLEQSGKTDKKKYPSKSGKAVKIKSVTTSKTRGKDEFIISWPRRKRNKREQAEMIDSADYKKMERTFKNKSQLKITLSAKVGKRVIARTYLFSLAHMTASAINNEVHTLYLDIMSGALDYELRKRKNRHLLGWRYLIDRLQIEFE